MTEETIQCRLVFPCCLNDHETLFGGEALKWMDEVAYITAVRHTRKQLVTIAVKDTEFLLPLRAGMIAEIRGKVIREGHVRLEVVVEIFAEDICSGTVLKAAHSSFIFAAIDENHKATRL